MHRTGDVQSDNASVPPHTLFVKKSCRYCDMFVRVAEEIGISGLINTIDIDITPTDTDKIRSVPTVVVNHQRVFVGRDAFAWLQNEKETSVSPAFMGDDKGIGSSCTFTYVAQETDGEYEMSTSFLPLTPEEKSNAGPTNKEYSSGDLESRMQALQQSRRS